MSRPTMQRQKHTQQGLSRAFAPYQSANQRQRSHNDNIDIELSLQNMSIQSTPRSRGGRPTARRGKSVVRGEGRIVGRGRAMSTQGLNESLFGSQQVSHRNQAQGIFTRQQEQSSLSKPNQGSTLKPAQTSSVLGDAQKQQQQSALIDPQHTIANQGLNPMAEPFMPDITGQQQTIAKQGLNPMAASFMPAKKSPLDPDANNEKNEQPLPSDVPSADALTRAMDHLVGEVTTNKDLEKCLGPIRAILQDFTSLNIQGTKAVKVLERVARLYIMCLHEMCELDESRFNHQQEMEQLSKVLVSLMELYDDLRLEGIEAENEPEFRGYHIVVHLGNQDVVSQTTSLPMSLSKHPQIQLALKFHNLAQRSNEVMVSAYSRNKSPKVPAAQRFYSHQFFKLVAKPETPFLMACLLESHFVDVRKNALKAMNNVVHKHQLSGVPASYLESVLGYDSLHQLMEEAHLYGLVVDESLEEPTFRLEQEPLTNPPQRRSAKLVEPKRGGMSFKNIINGEEDAYLEQDLHMPVESTPQPDQHGANESNPETPKAPEAAADPIIEQQRFEILMKRTAELNESARQRALQDKEEQNRRQRALQEKLRLEEEQKIIALLEKKEQEKERRLRAEARWRRQQRLDFEEEQTVMALLDKEVQEKARRLEAEESKRRQEKLRLEEEQKIIAFLEKKEKEKERRLRAEARWRRQLKLDFEEEQTVMALLYKEVQEKARRLEAEESKRRQENLCLDQDQKVMALQEKEEKEKTHRLGAEACWRRQEKSYLEQEQEKARLLEAEESKRRQEEESKRKEKEKQEKARRLEAEASKRVQEEVRKRKAIEERIKEIATVYKMKQNKMLKSIQEKTKPWLSRSRHNIEKRNASIAKRAEILRFSVKLHNNNPYSGFKIDNLYKRYKLRTPEIMEDRAKIALQSEKIAEEFNVYKNEKELLDYVWRKENFNGFAYREVEKKLYQPQIEGKHAWTHLISCDPTATNSINWFSHKFDLDGEYRRKTSRYEEVDISTKLVDSTEQLYPKLNNEVEAITFVLPEKRVENERHDNAFWQSQRNRLAELIQALSKERPDFQCPILVTYYSDDISDVHDTLYNIPELLDFKNEKAIMDYHVLLMRKESITTRICDEMFWLSEASVNC